MSSTPTLARKLLNLDVQLHYENEKRNSTRNCPVPMSEKTNLTNLLALTAVAGLSVAHSAKANLITNSGFATGHLTGWTQITGLSPGYGQRRLAAFR